MDWGSIGGLIKGIAPVLGTALGGPLGGIAGSVLASALGTDATPDAVGKAIEAGGATVNTAVQSAEREATARWGYLMEAVKADAVQSQAINATMQAEVAKGQPWWAWRNLYGYSVVMETTAVSWVILYALVFAAALFKNVEDSFGFFLSWYGLRFGLLGFIYRGASNEKIAAVTGEAPSIVGSLVKAFKR